MGGWLYRVVYVQQHVSDRQWWRLLGLGRRARLLLPPTALGRAVLERIRWEVVADAVVLLAALFLPQRWVLHRVVDVSQ